jgi:hypothetical protein
MYSPASRQPLHLWPLLFSHRQSIGLLEWGISASQDRYVHTGQHKLTNIHARSGIQHHDPQRSSTRDHEGPATSPVHSLCAAGPNTSLMTCAVDCLLVARTCVE